jgi:hypothetical protein
MDEKNANAIAAAGIENLLTRFVNLPTDPGSSSRAEEYERQNGELFRGLGPGDYWGYVQIFRQAWTAKAEDEIRATGMHLQRIFERESGLPTSYRPDDITSRPAIEVDFATGRIALRPRTLLDVLAATLLAHRDKLGYCEREGDCPHPYYIKSHARQRFCCPSCADTIRKQKKSQWWKDHREGFIQKWRNERKGTKGRKIRTRKGK